MERYLRALKAAALTFVIYLPGVAIADTPKDQWICGTSALLATPTPVQGPEAPPPKISGDFVFEGVANPSAEGSGKQKPVSFTLHVKDNVVDGTAVFDDFGSMKVSGMVLLRGIDLQLTDAKKTHLRVSATPFRRNIRGIILDIATKARWTFSATQVVPSTPSE